VASDVLVNLSIWWPRQDSGLIAEHDMKHGEGDMAQEPTCPPIPFILAKSGTVQKLSISRMDCETSKPAYLLRVGAAVRRWGRRFILTSR
jgi:hypothetical protein